LLLLIIRMGDYYSPSHRILLIEIDFKNNN